MRRADSFPYDDVVKSDGDGESKNCKGYKPYIGGNLGWMGCGQGDWGYGARGH